MGNKDIENILYAEHVGDCTTSNLRLEAALPPAPTMIVTDEIPDVDIEFVTE
jgi:hypothetical protein